jgi:hypothetical protein
MAEYKLTDWGTILRPSRNMSIPPDPTNPDYQEYLAWVAEGNTPDPADPPPVRFQEGQAISDQARTVGTTPVEIFRATLAQLTAYRARLVLLAVDSGNGAYASLERVVSVERLGAGAVNLLTTDTVVQRMTNAAAVTAGVASWAVTVTTSGNDIVVTVTGAAGRTVDWGLSGEFVRYTPGGF